MSVERVRTKTEDVKYDHIQYTNKVVIEWILTEHTFIEELQDFVLAAKSAAEKLKMEESDKKIFDNIIARMEAVISANPFFQNVALKNLGNDFISADESKKKNFDFVLGEDQLKSAFEGIINVIDNDMQDYSKLFGDVIEVQTVYVNEMANLLQDLLEKNKKTLINTEYTKISTFLSKFKNDNPVNKFNQRSGKYELLLREMLEKIDKKNPEYTVIESCLNKAKSARQTINTRPFYATILDLRMSDTFDKAVSMLAIHQEEEAVSANIKVKELQSSLNNLQDETYEKSGTRIESIYKENKNKPVSKFKNLSLSEMLLYEIYAKLDKGNANEENCLKRLKPMLQTVVSIEVANQNILSKIRLLDELLLTIIPYSNKVVSEKELKKMKKELMESYDNNSVKLQDIKSKVDVILQDSSNEKIFVEIQESVDTNLTAKRMKDFDHPQQDIATKFKELSESNVSNIKLYELGESKNIKINAIANKWASFSSENETEPTSYQEVMRMNGDIQENLRIMELGLNKIDSISKDIEALNELEKKQNEFFKSTSEIVNLKKDKQLMAQFNDVYRKSLSGNITDFDKYYSRKNKNMLADIANKRKALTKELAQEEVNINKLDSKLVDLRRKAIVDLPYPDEPSNGRVNYAKNKVDLLYDNVLTELEESFPSKDDPMHNSYTSKKAKIELERVAATSRDSNNGETDKLNNLKKAFNNYNIVDEDLKNNKNIKNIEKGLSECQEKIMADFETRKINNEKLRVKLRETNPVVKIDKKQSVIENKESFDNSLSKLKNNCDKMVLLLREQQNYLTGKDAEVNAVRLNKYLKAQIELKSIAQNYSSSPINGHYKLLEVINDKSMPQSVHSYLKEIEALEFSPGRKLKKEIENNLSMMSMVQLKSSMMSADSLGDASQLMTGRIVEILNTCQKYYNLDADKSKHSKEIVNKLTDLIDRINKMDQTNNLSVDGFSSIVTKLDMAREQHENKTIGQFFKPDTFTSALKQLTHELRDMRLDVVVKHERTTEKPHE